ncbi:MAG: hypothetical protein M0Z59_05055 [Nitrospiraceae bacterium]|nr:hypothetical protein [Nitrospiraceae bacterium]
MSLSVLLGSCFTGSVLGMYLGQSFLHSLVAAVASGGAVRIWGIESPAVRQRFRLGVIIAAVFSFPVYQLIDPDRGSAYFRLGAVFDSARWLTLELAGIPLSIFFLLMIAATGAVFLHQELIPVIGHTLEARKKSMPESARPLNGILPGGPGVFVFQSDELLSFSIMGREPAIYISSGLEQVLDAGEVAASIAHEAAHIERNRKPMLTAVFFLRVLQFFNPVALFEFRKIVQEEEKICDGIAASATGRPEALAGALRKIYRGAETASPKSPLSLGDIEEYSHGLHIKSRIERLERWECCDERGRWPELAFTFFAIAAINYFMV